MLDEEQNVEAVDRVQKERSEDFRQDEQYRQLESVVDGVQDYYTASRNPMCDLTHDQKEELYAHITSVFTDRRRTMKVEWVPQLRFALAVMTGTAALVASVPLFNWVSDIERPVHYSPEGTLRPYDPPEIMFLERSKPEPMLEPVEVFDDILLKPDETFDPVTYPMLPWQEFDMELGQPSLELPEFDFEESIVSLIDADVAPVPVNRSAPNFPSEARRNHLNGHVIVEFVVDETGSVHQPHIASSSHRVFESSALEAIRRWEFTPGEKDGEIVKVRMRMPFVYNFNR